MNSLVDAYRSKVPNDSRSDEELTLLFGKANDIDGRYNSYSDFVNQYESTKREDIPISSEFRRGVSRGVDSLKESGYGLGALAADVVGADSARDYLLKKYKDTEAESAEENASAVPRVEDVKDFGTGLRFVLGKAGELIPQIGEALVFGAAGALAGSSAAPGAGTVAGGTAGVTEGFLARQSAKAIVKAGIEKILSKSTLAAAEREIVKNQIEKVAAKEVIDGAVHTATKEILSEAIKAKSTKMGMVGAELLNFYGIGAGTIYGDLGNREGVDKGDAKAAALVGGIGSALANAPLPTVVLSRFFPGVGHEVAESYIKRLAKDVAIELPIGATGETLDELVQIAAEKYADPKRRDTGLDDQDLSRLLNAAVVGAGAGAMTSVVSAIPGGGESKPSVFPDEVKKRYWPNVTDDRKSQILGLHTRAKLGALNEQDENTFRLLKIEERNYFDSLSDLTEKQLNEETASVTKSKEVIPNGKVEEENKGRKNERRVLKEEPQSEENPLVGTSTPEITPDQVKSLVALGYDQNDIDSMTVDDAASFISENLESPKLARRNKMRAAATSTKTTSASEARLKQKIDEAAKKTKPAPTPEEAATGEYPKGKVDVGGIPVVIETAKGELRQNKKGGEPWSVIMPSHYGDVEGTIGADGDPVDVYVGDHPESDRVWVVDQIDPKTKLFDEHKSFLGFETPEQVVAAYNGGFSDDSGASRNGGITEMTRDEFKAWSKSESTKKALRYDNPKTETKSETAPTKTQESKPAVVFGEVGDLKVKKVKLKDPIHGEEIPFKSGDKADKYLRSQYETLNVLLKCVGGAA